MTPILIGVSLLSACHDKLRSGMRNGAPSPIRKITLILRDECQRAAGLLESNQSDLAVPGWSANYDSTLGGNARGSDMSKIRIFIMFYLPS